MIVVRAKVTVPLSSEKKDVSATKKLDIRFFKLIFRIGCSNGSIRVPVEAKRQISKLFICCVFCLYRFFQLGSFDTERR